MHAHTRTRDPVTPSPRTRKATTRRRLFRAVRGSPTTPAPWGSSRCVVEALERRALMSAGIVGVQGQFVAGGQVTIQVESNLPAAGAPLVTADFEAGLNPAGPGLARSWNYAENITWGDGYTGKGLVGVPGATKVTAAVEATIADGHTYTIAFDVRRNYAVDASNNLKTLRFWAGQPGAYPDMYVAESNLRVATETHVGPLPNGYWGGFRIPPDTWNHAEYVLKASSAAGRNDGVLWQFLNGKLVASGNVLTHDAEGILSTDYLVHTVFANFTPPSGYQVKYDNVLLTRDAPRAILADAATLGQAHTAVSLIPVSAGGHSVTVQVATGKFMAGQTAYVFYSDPVTGETSQTGYAVRVGGTSPPPPAPGNGLRATYFDNKDLTGASVTRTDASVNFNWGYGSPASAIAPDTFSARWVGQVLAPTSGTYTFYTRSDDGVRLWVNGQLLVDQWNDHATTEHSGSIALTAGQRYDIRMEYYDDTEDAVAQLLWAGPSLAKSVIPQTYLYSTPG